MLGWGYRAETFTNALAGAQGNRTFAVTFDDAYSSVFERAFPILRELGVPGTVFVPTRADRDGLRHWEGIAEWSTSEWRDELHGTSWPELGELQASGWEIGSHTRSHPDLTLLEERMVAEELEGSRLDCEEALGEPPTSIAYPYGQVNRLIVKAASDAGYQVAAALSLSSGTFSEGQLMSWPRMSVYREDADIRFKAKLAGMTWARPALSVVQRVRGD